MFCGVVVATDTVLQSLKWQISSGIKKSWMQNFPRYESKSNDQNTKIVRFYFSYFLLFRCERSSRNSFLVSCSKRLCKWRSWEAGSNSLNKVVSIINAQRQLFDNDYNNCKPVEKTQRSMCRSSRYIYIYIHYIYIYVNIYIYIIYIYVLFIYIYIYIYIFHLYCIVKRLLDR